MAMRPYFNKIENNNWKIIKYLGAIDASDIDENEDYYYISRIKDYDRYYLHKDRKIRWDIKNHNTGLFKGMDSAQCALEDFYKVTGEQTNFQRAI
jgi:hypothetical protein